MRNKIIIRLSFMYVHFVINVLENTVNDMAVG